MGVEVRILSAASRRCRSHAVESDRSRRPRDVAPRGQSVAIGLELVLPRSTVRDWTGGRLRTARSRAVATAALVTTISAPFPRVRLSARAVPRRWMPFTTPAWRPQAPDLPGRDVSGDRENLRRVLLKSSPGRRGTYHQLRRLRRGVLLIWRLWGRRFLSTAPVRSTSASSPLLALAAGACRSVAGGSDPWAHPVRRLPVSEQRAGRMVASPVLIHQPLRRHPLDLP